ncbi:Gas vesicle protein G [Bacillus sp. THAF10]|uniref:gas vesicle protein GvpG n=1 Tax=Bacillus sp. THAF10 TaxID=2587848 RepID=UPI001267B208|nr:gas vesicle protein GvpG [Bacillus sp. THAF10]QFT90422.1 Gas vesicle protein G [Bacillus sp. THAF10]
MLHKLFTAPLGMVVKLGEKIKDEVDKEIYDVDHIQRQLVQLEMLSEMNEISEEEYNVKEAELLQRYEFAKRREQKLFEDLKRDR